MSEWLSSANALVLNNITNPKAIRPATDKVRT
jgi:hypothetical protein